MPTADIRDRLVSPPWNLNLPYRSPENPDLSSPPPSCSLAPFSKFRVLYCPSALPSQRQSRCIALLFVFLTKTSPSDEVEKAFVTTDSVYVW